MKGGQTKHKLAKEAAIKNSDKKCLLQAEQFLEEVVGDFQKGLQMNTIELTILLMLGTTSKFIE
jgi:hypothetical protein